MTLAGSLDTIAESASGISPSMVEAVRPALARAAAPKGEFPSPLALVEKLRLEVGSDSARPEKVASIMSCCPIMSLRAVATANSAFYARGNPVESTGGAIHHLGMRRLQTIVEDLAEKKSFQATFLGRAVASSALQQTIIANILSVSIVNFLARGAGLGDRAHTLSCLLRTPALLMAFLRPSVYSAMALESLADPRVTFERTFKRVMDESVSSTAVSIGEGLSFPIQTTKLVSFLEIPPWNRRGGAEDLRDARALAMAVSLGQRLADEICRFSGFVSLDTAVLDLAEKAAVDARELKAIVGDVPQKFLETAQLLGFKPARLPAYLSNYRTTMVGPDGKEIPDKFKYPSIAERINPFLYELKACFNTRARADEFGYLPQAVLCTLTALVRALSFDRAVFFRYNESNEELRPVLVFGARPPDISLVSRSVRGSNVAHMPDVQALLQRKVIFFGDSVFGEDWPVAAFPIICQNRVEGVFFADKAAKKNPVPLDTQEQVAIVALAEGWHDVSSEFR